MQFYKADMLLSEISEDLQSYSKKLNNDVKKSNIKIKKNISSINYVNNSNYANNNIINSYKTIEPSSKIVTVNPDFEPNKTENNTNLLEMVKQLQTQVNNQGKQYKTLLKQYSQLNKKKDEKEDEKNEEEEEEGVESEKSGESGSGEDKESDNNNN